MSDPNALQIAMDLYRARRLHEAEVAARRIVDANPRDPMAMNLLGVIAHDVGRNDIAVQWLSRAIRIDPSVSMFYNNLGECYRAIGQGGAAIEAYRAAIARNPDDPNARNNLAIVYAHLGHLDEAIATWLELVRVRPDYHSAYNNLGNAYLSLAQQEEAVRWHRRAIEADPAWSTAHSNLLRDLQHLPDITGEMLLGEHRAWWKMHGQKLAQNIPPHANDPDPERPLVVGWLSPDFRAHAVAHFVEPILANRDRAAMRFIAYSNLPHEDETTARLKTYFDQWRPIFGIEDEHVAGQMRADRVDVLIDLAGHTAKNRATLVARKPAPVQVSFIGYPSTTGIETIDWRITDAKADPPGMTDSHNTEKLYRLSRTAWCYRPVSDAPDVAPAPVEANGYITFGSFNNLSKINPRVLDAWIEILLAVSDSRLILKYTGLNEPSVQRALLSRFKARGIDPARLALRGWERTITEHVAAYANVDIALDTFPYNGTTTTCEALWMGVPVVSVAGMLHEARVGASLLETVGLSELVADDVAGYVAKAVELARDRQRVIALRREIRPMVQRSALRDEPAYTREFENAIRQMWRDYVHQSVHADR
jgi:predicted O-linked N-acetylglucosamine transferase (SPINDLY family)